MKINLNELIKSEIITQETAEDISAYYNNKKSVKGQMLLVLFSILAALLLGSGIILILAHNWDNLPNYFKIGLVFCILILTQLLCVYTLTKKQDSSVWRETSSTLLFWAIGTILAIISQVYNISGSISSFMLTWLLIFSFSIYFMNSSSGSIFYIIGTILYGLTEVSAYNNISNVYIYLGLLLIFLPFYLLRLKNNSDKSSTGLLNWLVALALLIFPALMLNSSGLLFCTTYLNIFTVIFLVGTSKYFKSRQLIYNGYFFIGITGILVILYIFSFQPVWEKIADINLSTFLPDLLIIMLISIFLLIFILYSFIRGQRKNIQLLSLTFIIFNLFLLVKSPVPFYSVIIVNIFIILIGLDTILKGFTGNSIGIVNFGFFILFILIICRFIDIEISFFIKGLVFILAGCSIFAINYLVVSRRRKAHEE